MNVPLRPRFRVFSLLLATCSFLLVWLPLQAQSSPALSPALINAPKTNNPPHYGPFNAVVLPGGLGLIKPLVPHDSVLRAWSPWTLSCWIKLTDPVTAPTLVAGVGSTAEEYPRYLALDRGKLVLWMGKGNRLEGKARIQPGKWHFIAAVFDGNQADDQFHLYSDGKPVAAGELALGSVSPVLQIGPASVDWEPDDYFGSQQAGGRHFGGEVASLVLERKALDANQIRKLYEDRPDFALIEFEQGSKDWAIQKRSWIGYRAPQAPDLMPHGKAPFSAPVALPLPAPGPALETSGVDRWELARGWKMTPAPEVSAGGAEISTSNFHDKSWWVAVVPGTALTTMIDRGVYPDPDYGLNNLAIPESLNKQDYWYREAFRAPKAVAGKRLTLTFEGINYKADVWLNGKQLGSVTGAFIRGVFDVTGIVKPDRENVLAVLISPPPHPGIPQEQSIQGGPGENGGLMCLDGPTFVATEGWDWMPAIRDRDSGIWQPVFLKATGIVKIGDPQVITTLPLPKTDPARVEINVPLKNVSGAAVQGTLTASFEGVTVTRDVIVPAGGVTVKLTPAEYRQLTVEHPRLWWPNGYGKPNLYHLKLTFSEGAKISDTKQLHFGIREITYVLSLLDNTGHLRRVEYSPTEASALGEQVVDVSHRGIREIPAPDPPPAWEHPSPGKWRFWVASFAPGGFHSAAVHTVSDTGTAPYLVIEVNGVPIDCRGGNWGMDDMLKRVSRARLEPYFRLQRAAHLDIIRNWVGQNTEKVFYDLADEYGMLVWNDFWESTQNDNVQAENPELFLKNARDVILRFRNHPSIVIWCGRNEGVPQPIINRGLARLVRTLDGTRYYTPASNRINLQRSGPYFYQDPALYYTTLNHGFSVETGTPSFPTLESFRAWIPKADQWPIDDVWAYHDWHQSQGGRVEPFMDQIQTEFGAPTSLIDFERKAQMLNYVDHRAIFEGMNAHLWAPNSGRMLWMTQPAWPSTVWQIYSWDYDTQASYYGVMKACEPVHIQLDLSNYDVDVVNTTRSALVGLTATSDVYSVDNKLLLHRSEPVNLGSNSVTHLFQLNLSPLFSSGVIFIKLELKDASGKELSSNFYWLGSDSEAYRELTRMPGAAITASATELPAEAELLPSGAAEGDAKVDGVRVLLRNTGSSTALEVKLTLLNQQGARILPAYYSDNYVSLLPGASHEIDIHYPATAQKETPEIALRGWNLESKTIPVAAR